MTGAVTLSYGQGDLLCRVPLPARAAAPPLAGLAAGLSLAAAGDMALTSEQGLSNRARFLDIVGVSRERAFAAHQVHSKTVIAVGDQGAQSLAALEADGMVTSRPDAVLTVTVADCLPIFLADRRTGAFGLVHSGWRGTGIVREAIRVMSESFGTSTGDILAVIGPGIGPCCYTVGQERYDGFRARFGEAAVSRGPEGDFRLDLKTANVKLLEAAGVSSILVTADCTGCSPALGSFRREGDGFRRMLAFLGRWEAP